VSDGGVVQLAGSAGCRPTSKFTGRSTDIHVVGGRVEHPVVALARVVVVARNLDEAFVEAKVVSDRVLPALPVVAVVWKVAYDEVVDAAEREAALRTAADRHHDHGVVAVRRLI